MAARRVVDTRGAGDAPELGPGPWRPRSAGRRASPPGAGRFWSEPAGALAIVALFVAGGLAAASLRATIAPAAGRAGATYLGVGMTNEDGHGARIWLVDGFNLLHAAVLSGRERSEWWREPARARVVDLAGALPDADAEIWVVFDGDEPGEAAGDGARVRQVFARSADEWLVRRVKETPRGSAVAVVTADRSLAARARHHGAEIVSPRAFAERCRRL